MFQRVFLAGKERNYILYVEENKKMNKIKKTIDNQ